MTVPVTDCNRTAQSGGVTDGLLFKACQVEEDRWVVVGGTDGDGTVRKKVHTLFVKLSEPARSENTLGGRGFGNTHV